MTYLAQGHRAEWVLDPAGCHIGQPSSLSPRTPSISANVQLPEGSAAGPEGVRSRGELGVAISSEVTNSLLPVTEEGKWERAVQLLGEGSREQCRGREVACPQHRGPQLPLHRAEGGETAVRQQQLHRSAPRSGSFHAPLPPDSVLTLGFPSRHWAHPYLGGCWTGDIRGAARWGLTFIPFTSSWAPDDNPKSQDCTDLCF